MGYVAGANLSATVTSTTDGTGHKLGAQMTDNSGNEYVYVQADGAITAGHCVAVDENFQAKSITSQLATEGHAIGFAQIAFADNEYGWVCTRGQSGIRALLNASCKKDDVLYTTDTAGILDDASASQKRISGVVAVTSATTTNELVSIIATFPRGVIT